MLVFLPLFIMLYLRTCTAHCNYEVDKFEEIICFNITNLEQIRDDIDETLIRHRSLPRLIEIVRFGQCELSHFTVQSLIFLPQLKKIDIFDSTITRLSYGADIDLFQSTDNFDNTKNSDETNGLLLHTIIMRKNHIKIIDPKALQGLANLHTLDLNENEITTISAETFSRTTVQELLLKRNRITTIQFDDSNNLINITLSFNKIKRVNVTSFMGPGIQKLDLAYNEIEVIEPRAFSSLKNLFELDLSDNRITKVESGTLYGSSMRVLYVNLDRNAIENVEFNCFAATKGHFESLSLWSNRLTKIHNGTFSGCSIKSLDLLGNGIEIIEPNSFNNMSSLYSLVLQSNRIAKISTNTFSIPSLEILNLWDNQITSIDPEAFIGANNLRELTLGENELSIIKKNMFSGTALQVLELDSNAISTIEPYTFEGLNNLRKLNLERNMLVRIDEKVLPGLSIQELYIGSSRNPYTTIEQDIFDKFNNLQYLSLAYSKMNRIPLFPATLRTLSLIGNGIVSIKAADFGLLNKTNSNSSTFSGPALEILELQHNQIANIEPYAFTNLNRLRSLTMSRNKLGRIEKYSFAQSTIEELYLDWNGITFIESGAFRGLHIYVLELSHNKITKIERNTFSGSSIQTLSMFSNKIEIIEPYAFSDVKNLYKLRLEGRSIKIDRNIFTSSTLKVLNLGHHIIKLSVAASEQLSNLTSLACRNYGNC